MCYAISFTPNVDVYGYIQPELGRLNLYFYFFSPDMTVEVGSAVSSATDALAVPK
jgi:hypothetical protein